MNVLVTGGGGFLGLEICKQLLSQGYKVTSLSRNSYVELEEINVDQIKADLSKELNIDLSKFDVIIHSAAFAGVWGDKKRFYEVNHIGTQNLVDKAIKDGVSKFIYTSSPSVVFGEKDLCGVDESCPYPDKYYTYYADSKALAEKYVLSKNSDYFKTLSIRPHLIWGKGDPHIFPRLLKSHKEGRLKIIGNGENQVDIIHVSNAAHAHLCALNTIDNADVSGRAYFVGQDQPVKLWGFINDVLVRSGAEQLDTYIGFKSAYYIGFIFEIIYRMLGITSPQPPMTRFIAMQMGKSHYFDHSNAKKFLGYSQIVTIKDGLDSYFSELETKKKIIDSIQL
jgi:nucleoside-diphosphate-sugar epimerase